MALNANYMLILKHENPRRTRKALVQPRKPAVANSNDCVKEKFYHTQNNFTSEKNYQLKHSIDGTPVTRVSESHVQPYDEVKNASLDAHNKQFRSNLADRSHFFPTRDYSNKKANLSKYNYENPKDKNAQHFDALERKNVYKFSRKRSQQCEVGPVWNGDLKVVIGQNTLYKNKSREITPMTNYNRKNSEMDKYYDKINRSTNKANSEQKKLVALLEKQDWHNDQQSDKKDNGVISNIMLSNHGVKPYVVEFKDNPELDNSGSKIVRFQKNDFSKSFCKADKSVDIKENDVSINPQLDSISSRIHGERSHRSRSNSESYVKYQSSLSPAKVVKLNRTTNEFENLKDMSKSSPKKRSNSNEKYPKVLPGNFVDKYGQVMNAEEAIYRKHYHSQHKHQCFQNIVVGKQINMDGKQNQEPLRVPNNTRTYDNSHQQNYNEKPLNKTFYKFSNNNDLNKSPGIIENKNSNTLERPTTGVRISRV